jgi:predicted acyltransferase
MPINKFIWTPSFVIFTGGLAMLVLGTVFWLTDIMRSRRWTLPFVIFGSSSIFAFVGEEAVRRSSILFWIDTGHAHRVQPLELVKLTVAESLHNANTWLQTLSPTLPSIDSGGMTSLVYSVVFMLAFLVLMSILYAMRIRVKV